MRINFSGKGEPEVKITRRKQKGERYALVFETEEEARQFRHYVGCRIRLENCQIEKVKNGEFHEILDNCILGKLPV